MLTLAQLEQRLAEAEWHLPQFGRETKVIAAKQALARTVLDTFRTSFRSSGDLPVSACFVPGRVELLGKHTDYAGGHSLLAAVDRGFCCVSARNGTDRVRLVEAQARFPACEFKISTDLEPPMGHWSNYPMTMVKRLAANFPDLLPLSAHGSASRLAGVDVAFASDLPVAGGLSGSSALMIMVFFALALPNRLRESERFRENIRDNLELANYLACVENGQTYRELAGGAGVGTFGGSEDHTQILNAKAGALSLYQFCPTRHKADLAFPEDLALVLAHSGVHAEKTGAARERFNLAAQRAKLVVAACNERLGTGHQLLRDLFVEGGAEEPMLARLENALVDQDPSLDLLGRLVQFFREDRQLIPRAVSALEARDYPLLGEVIDQSHALSRTCLRNIVPEIDHLQESARELGAVAASGFGAGFGGSAYALVRKTAACDFTSAWREEYLRRFPERTGSEFFVAGLSGGGGEMFQ